MNTLHDKWESFAATTGDRLLFTQMSFYSGAAGVVSILSQLERDNVSLAGLGAVIRSLHHECCNYRDTLNNLSPEARAKLDSRMAEAGAIKDRTSTATLTVECDVEAQTMAIVYEGAGMALDVVRDLVKLNDENLEKNGAELKTKEIFGGA